MIKRADWLAITKDRMAILLLFLAASCVITLIVTTILRLQPSDIQVPVRFTGYGQSNIFRDQWYTLIGLPVFSVLVAGINGFLSVKLYPLSRVLGLGFLAMTIFILVMALIISNAIFSLAPTV